MFKILEGGLTRGSSGAAGWDIRCIEGFVLGSDVIKVDTGLKVEIDPGWFGSIRGRSGLGLKGVIVLGGVIDSDYRGEVGVIMCCLGEPIRFKAGDRIAQMVVQPCWMPAFEGGDERGTGGFGSTGQ